MALIAEDREIRTTRPTTPRDSSTLRDDYARYLQSPYWRRRRNEALRDAGWQCQRCPSRTGLQVHHRTYVNLGAEQPGDLEVLCRPCHEGEHLMQDQREHAGVYVRVVSAALKEGRFESMADLLDAVKTACSRLRIPYRSEQIWSAVRDLDAKRKGILDAPERPVVVTPVVHRDITRTDAVEILRRLNVKVGLREMPQTAALTDDAINVFKAAFVWERGRG